MRRLWGCFITHITFLEFHIGKECPHPSAKTMEVYENITTLKKYNMSPYGLCGDVRVSGRRSSLPSKFRCCWNLLYPRELAPIQVLFMRLQRIFWQRDTVLKSLFRVSWTIRCSLLDRSQIHFNSPKYSKFCLPVNKLSIPVRANIKATPVQEAAVDHLAKNMVLIAPFQHKLWHWVEFFLSMKPLSSYAHQRHQTPEPPLT